MTEWIKCSVDNLPSEYERVLFSEGKTVYSGFFWTINPQSRYVFITCSEGSPIYATHWAELPAPPSEKL